jgi:translation initiation factor 1
MPGGDDYSRTVYSTEYGRICPNCGQPATKCHCKKPQQRPQGDGVVRVRVESKGRGGKTVTTISGLTLDDEQLRALAADLKKRCGAGGAVKDGVIEIQGNHADTLVEALKARGHRAKRAGG